MPANSPDVQRPTNVRYVVLFGLSLAAGLAYLHRGCFGGAETTIRHDLGLDTRETAWGLSIFFWSYALFQIPTGMLVDAWGARKSLLLFGMLGAATMALGAGTLVLGATAGFAVLLLSRGLMGIAQAGLFPASTRCIATWFPLRRRAFAAGMLQACMSIGGGVGAIITGALLSGTWSSFSFRITFPAVGWPWLFVIYAIPGVVWSLWFFAWYRDRPADHPSANAAEKALLLATPAVEKAPAPSQGRAPWWLLASRPKLQWLCWSQFFRAAANVFWLTWCPTYLQSVYGLSPGDAGWLTFYPFIGVVLGSLVGGWLSDRVLAATGSKRLSRNGVAIIGAAIGIGFFAAAWLIPAGPDAVVALLFLAATFTSFGNPCSYSVSIDIGGKYMAVVFGAMNMMGNFGSAAFPLVVRRWTGELGWASLPLLMGLTYLAGLICWCFVNPEGTILDDARRHGTIVAGDE